MPKENVNVKIFNNEFTLKSTDSNRERTEMVAEYVDEKMNEISKKTGLVSTSKLGILTALNIAEDLFKIKDDRNNIANDELNSIKETIQLINKIL